MSAAECASCGERFSGVTTFDRHQDRDYSRRSAVICLPPAERGLVRNEHGRWGFPLNEAGRAYFESRKLGKTPAEADAFPCSTS